MPLGAARINTIGRYSAPTGRTARTVTAFNDAQVDTAQSKFGSASALFDGGNDYLRYEPVNTKFGTGNFTVEFWFRTSAKTQQYPVLWNNMAGFGTDAIVIHERHSSYPNNLTVWVHNESTGAPVLTSTTTISNTTWYHCAVVRDGSTLRLFINGTEEDTHTIVNSDIDPALSTTYAYIGGNGAADSAYHGYIDELRVSDIARYTTGFSVATVAFTNDADTTLLLHMDGTDGSTSFPDDNGDRFRYAIRAINNAQVDTAQSKFGGSSILFDGNDDYLLLDTIANDSSGEFTLEAWLRFDILPTNQTIGGGSYMMLATRSSDTYILIQNAKVQIAMTNSYYGFTIPTISTGTWYHLAIVRESNNDWFVYWDGDKKTGVVDGGDVDVNKSGNWLGTGLTIGRFIDSRGSWDGHIDEFRMSKVARYTANFTPSTVAFTNDADTICLIHADAADATTDFLDDNGAS